MNARPAMDDSRITIRTYVSPIGSFVRQTGVSRHAVEMLAQLNQRPSQIKSELLVSRHAFEGVKDLLPECFHRARLVSIAGSERLSRRLLLGSRLIAADGGLKSTDWVYSPTMQPVHCRRARLAVTIHDSLSFEDPQLWGRAVSNRKVAKDRVLLQRSLRRASLVCVVSRHLLNRIHEVYPWSRQKRFVVVGNGAAEVFYGAETAADRAVLDSFGLSGRRFVISVGDLVFRKGGDLLLELARELTRSRDGIDVVVAGGKRDEMLCSDRDLSDSGLRTLGHVEAERLAVLLRHSVALVLASRCESFGIPAAEAMAAGTPVISSSAHALPEIVGDAGYFFDVRSVDELVRRVRAVAQSAQLREELVRRGRERARGFTWYDCGSRLVTAMLE